MGSVYAGQSSYSSAIFTAPTEPGYYYITLVSKWVYWCHQRTVNHCNNNSIALIRVGNPQGIQVELDTIHQESICDGNDGALGINISSQSDYGCYATYWTGPNGFDAAGQTTITNLEPGDYQVVVTPITGCDTTLTFTIEDACDPCTIQEIPIDEGWNMISSYIYPRCPPIWPIYFLRYYLIL